MAYKDARAVCGPWATPDDLCCDDETVTDCETGAENPAEYKFTDEEWILAASNILYARTCYRYPGVCTRRVYPCLECRRCDHPCECGVYEAIELQDEFPVLAVTDVVINGVPLDPLAYRVDDFDRVVRIDGENWPTSNGLDVPDSSRDTLYVDYTFGIEPPVELRMAAAELACQMKRACNGDACNLAESKRERIRSYNRRGTSVTLESLAELVARGSFGNAIIDQALAAHGNCGKTQWFDPAKRRRSVQVDTIGQ